MHKISNKITVYKFDSEIMSFDIRCSECNRRISEGVKFEDEIVLCKKCLKKALEILYYIAG